MHFVGWVFYVFSISMIIFRRDFLIIPISKDSKIISHTWMSQEVSKRLVNGL